MIIQKRCYISTDEFFSNLFDVIKKVQRSISDVCGIQIGNFDVAKDSSAVLQKK